MLAAGLIADDLTGALDSGAPFAHRCLRTRVFARLGETVFDIPKSADVVAVNTASRHVTAELAAILVQRACRTIMAAAPALLFKKIDSTLRGNVVVETLAVMAACDRPYAVVAPAVPAQNRIVRSGLVLVDGVPLERTSFARDALSAPLRAPLENQFKSAAPSIAVTVGTTPPKSVANRQVWIADAETDQDLRVIAAWADDCRDQVLLVGAAGLAHATAAASFPQAQRALTRIAAPFRTLFVVGSRAPVSRAQLAYLTHHDSTCTMMRAARGHFSVAHGARALKPAAARLAIAVPESPTGDATTVATDLARNVAALLARSAADGVRPAVVVVTGGDIAVALLDALGHASLDLIDELRPGIPLSRLDLDGAPLWLVSKAGGFGTERLFVELPAILAGLGGDTQ